MAVGSVTHRGDFIADRKSILKSKGRSYLDLISKIMHNKSMHMVAFILLIVGGLNWLLVGLSGFVGGNLNIVNLILGSMPQLEWIVYILVGLSAVYEIATHKAHCKDCNAGGSM